MGIPRRPELLQLGNDPRHDLKDLVGQQRVLQLLEAVLTRAGQMRTRQANMLVLARSLRTNSVPRLVRAKKWA